MKVLFALHLFFFTSVFGQNFQPKMSTFSLPAAEEESGPNTTARLIAERDQFVPGETLWVGIELTMKPHWHTYWENPGDSGMPTTVRWELPQGFEISEFYWPTPARLVLEGLVSYGYENQAVLRMKLTTPADFPLGETLTLKGQVDWLECKEVCLPGGQQVSLQLRAVEQAAPSDSSWQSQGRVQAADDVGEYWMELGKVVLSIATDRAYTQFFPFGEGVWQLEPAPEIRQTDNGIEVRLTPLFPVTGAIPLPDGLLLDAEGNGYTLGAYEIHDSGAVPISSQNAVLSARGLLPTLLFAFIGGVILNLLPCVFPVLGLKVSGFLEQAHGDPKQAKIHSLVFSFGILTSLWLLAAVVSSLNMAWGGQLGDPTTVIVLILLLSLFTLNLFGVFEIGYFFTRLGGGASQKKGYAGSFFSGVLVTIIATPCTAPFMGGAISWALTQPAIYAFMAFTALGMGIAAPYVMLSFSPKLMEKMPRPGAWMETFKQGTAFFMLAFVWLLLWVLSSLVPVEVLTRVLGAICLLTLAAWILGKWGAIHRSQKEQRWGKGISIVLIALAARLALTYEAPIDTVTAQLEQRISGGEPIMYSELEPEIAQALRERGVPIHWAPFTPEKLEGLLATNTPVFIDFTAKWCLTCQANKRSTLFRPEVMKTLQDAGVVTLAADLTKDDPILKKALDSYGRRGVPTYVVYNREGKWVLLPETLTPGLVTGALN